MVHRGVRVVVSWGAASGSPPQLITRLQTLSNYSSLGRISHMGDDRALF